LWLLVEEGYAILSALTGANPALVLVALLAAFANLALAALSWRCLLPMGSAELSPSIAARIFFLSQLGKYLPGGIWNFVAAGELGREAGMARTAIIGSFVVAVMIGAGTGLALALLLVPQARENLLFSSPITIGLLVAALLILLGLPLLRGRLVAQLAIFSETSPLALAGSAMLALAAWMFAGLMVATLNVALGGPFDSEFLLLATGAYAFGWIAGFVVVVAPAGLAVREGALIAILATEMSLAEAGAIALLARAVVTLADVLAACAASLIPRNSTAPEAHEYRDRA
jgi:hypothetical protein